MCSGKLLLNYIFYVLIVLEHIFEKCISKGIINILKILLWNFCFEKLVQECILYIPEILFKKFSFENLILF